MKVGVVYASQTGRTRRMAEALGEGVLEAGAELWLRDAASAEVGELESLDALVLGSGVQMGGMQPTMGDFLGRTAPLWLQGRLVGRLGGAFVCAGAGGRGGGELVLVSLWAALAEHGLLLVPMPNRLEGFGEAGCHWGPLSQTQPRGGEPGPTPAHLVAARAHGVHVVRCAERLHPVSPPAAAGGA